ncbi:MFS transporter [Actinomadura kijaniata]|uniref:MFS transporter n=1 Tax=Actinomadura kijaniata TaxID=46161 RepID=UPI003F1DF7E1
MSPRWTLAVVTVTGYLLVLDLIGVNVALPDLRRDLDAGLAEAQWAVDAYALALAVLLLPAGALADRLGRRRFLLAGLAVFTAASLACALAPSAPVLDALRAVQGAGAALLYGTASPLLAALHPPGPGRNRALAVLAAAAGAAGVTGPPVGGVLTEAFGWRTLFLLNVPVGLAALAVAVRAVRESRDPDPRPLDPGGTGLLAAALGGLLWALIEGPRAGWGGPEAVGGLAVAVLASAALARRRTAVLAPLGGRLFRANAVAACALHVAGAGSLVYFSLYVQGPMGARPAEAGAWFLAYSLPGLAAPLLLARVAHRLPPAALVAAGPLLLAASCLLLAATCRTHAWGAMVPGFVLGGLGMGIGNLAASQVALAAVPARAAGVASGVTNTGKQVGVAAGIAALGVPYGTSGVAAMFATAAALAVAGALPALLSARAAPALTP